MLREFTGEPYWEFLGFIMKEYDDVGARKILIQKESKERLKNLTCALQLKISLHFPQEAQTSIIIS